jgi:hypothetical protein
MTTLRTTAAPATGAEATAAAVALDAGLDAVAGLYTDAMECIAHLAETWDQPEDDAPVVRLTERPTVIQRAEAAAA